MKKLFYNIKNNIKSGKHIKQRSIKLTNLQDIEKYILVCRKKNRYKEIKIIMFKRGARCENNSSCSRSYYP